MEMGGLLGCFGGTVATISKVGWFQIFCCFHPDPWGHDSI